MPTVKSVSVKISVDGAESAKLAIDKVAVKAEELKKLDPTITPQIDSAKALLQARILRAGLKAELGKSITENVRVRQSLSNKLAGGLLGANGGGGGLLGAAGGASGGGLSGGSSILGSIGGVAGGLGWVAIAAAIAASATELAGVVAGLTAATAGVGAFGLLAIPTFDKIKNAYTSIDAAQQNYNKAEALYKESPTKTNATAAAAALVKLKTAQEGVTGSTKTAVTGIHDLIGTFDKMAKAFAPQVMTVFNQGLKIANQLLPTLKVPAQDAATAISGLLTQFSKFTQSKGFKDWLTSFDKLIGPSIAAIGHGIGEIAVAFGDLISRFSSRDVAHAINILFDTVSGVLTAIVNTIAWFMNAWDIGSKNIARTWRVIEIAFDTGARVVIGAVQMIGDKILGLIGGIVGFSAKVATALHLPWAGTMRDWAKSVDGFRTSFDSSMGGAQNTLKHWVTNLQNAPKIAKIKGDITDLQAKIDAAEKHLSDPNLTKNRVARVEANISQLMSQLAAARKALAAINGATATTYVITSTSSIPGAKGPGHPLGHASGGWASGLIRVGELGPEVLQVPPGSYVHSNADSQRMFGGSTYNIHVSALVADRNTGGHIVEAIRKYEAGSGSGWRK